MDYHDRLQELGITLEDTGYQTCPQCSASRKKTDDKCLSIKYTDNAVLYNCHHCGFQGAVFYNHPTVKRSPYKAYTKPKMPEKTGMLLDLYDYFERRGISKQTLDEYEVTLNENNEIVFPYKKDGELVNIKYRSFNKTFRQEKDTEKTPFGIDLVKGNTLIWVEGEIDVLSLAEQGIHSVSVPQGARDKSLDCITNCYDKIIKFEKYIIAVDNDEAGEILKNNLLERLPNEKCLIVNWGKYKDANEALVAGEKLIEYINAAKPINPDGVKFFADNLTNIIDSFFNEDKTSYSTGWKKLDNIIKLRTGYLMVVTGYPSRGKSTFVDNLLVNLTKKYGFKHLIASFESTETTAYKTYLEMVKEKSFDLLKLHPEELTDDADFISEHFIRLDTSKQWTIDEIVKKTEEMVTKFGIKTLVIDPYNRLKNNFKEREDKYIGDILSKLCMIAKKLNILIVFVAHPKKPDDEKEPDMYSISGSGDWYNMADYGIIVHRDRNKVTGKLNDEPKITIAKVKNYDLGNPSGGVITLSYDVNKRILLDVRGER